MDFLVFYSWKKNRGIDKTAIRLAENVLLLLGLTAAASVAEIDF